MKIVTSLLLSYILFIIQLALVPYIGVSQSTPNLVLIALVGLLFSRRLTTGSLVAGFSGLLFDLYSPLRFGIYTLVFLLIYILSTTVLRRLLTQASLLSFLGVILFALIIGEAVTLATTLEIKIFVGNIFYSLAVSLAGYILFSIFRERTLKI